MHRDIPRGIQTQKRAIERLTRAAREVVISDPELGRLYQLLLSIHGFATTNALHILAERFLLPTAIDVRQWVAYAGVLPHHHTCGFSVEKKSIIPKPGNEHLRRAFCMPEVTGFCNHIES